MFRDRSEAGRALAARLSVWSGRTDVVVVALPRGGVPVAAEVADALQAPLDILVARKLGLPGHEELAMGAVAPNGIVVLDEPLIARVGVSAAAVAAVRQKEERELERRQTVYRGGRSEADVAGRIVILVDDGLATGATMRAALQSLRSRHPARIVVAVPVGARETCEKLQSVADEVVCAITPAPFYGVGQWYDDFAQTTDREVIDLLHRAKSASR
jgi:putative phosphoribosyl transferase